MPAGFTCLESDGEYLQFYTEAHNKNLKVRIHLGFIK